MSDKKTRAEGKLKTDELTDLTDHKGFGRSLVPEGRI